MEKPKSWRRRIKRNKYVHLYLHLFLESNFMFRTITTIIIITSSRRWKWLKLISTKFPQLRKTSKTCNYSISSIYCIYWISLQSYGDSSVGLLTSKQGGSQSFDPLYASPWWAHRHPRTCKFTTSYLFHKHDIQPHELVDITSMSTSDHMVIFLCFINIYL